MNLTENTIEALIENSHSSPRQGQSATQPIKSVESVVGKLCELAEEYTGKIVYSTGFGFEAQVIKHLIFSYDIPIRVFTIDTGRLFPETIALKQKIEEKYDKTIEVYHPNQAEVTDLVGKKGLYSFYESVANREECCFIRKVKPLQIALDGVACWITGIRAEQSAHRQQKMSQWEWNEKYQLHKFHPLYHWTWAEIKEFIKVHDIPYNALHDRGYPSVGCQPCTRAIKKGEDDRAGRWWWETESSKECGLHK
jgi:phosphoadenosine phosphosulfate reductase